jgi:hypothetical protein
VAMKFGARVFFPLARSAALEAGAHRGADRP